MEEYKPNSNKYKQEQKELANEKRATKIVTNPVKAQQKSEAQKFLGKFIVEDLKSVASHIVTDTLIPGAKKVLYDMFTGGLSSLLFGGRGNPAAPGGTNVAGRVAYRDFYSGAQYQTPVSPRPATAYDYNEIIFSSRADAVDVLTRMDEILAKYRTVRVTDLYDLVGMTGNYTDNRYGWTNLSSADVVPVRDGFMIRLPKALPIE